MKVKRHKHIKKTLAFYKNHFNISAPYNILIDGTFCKAALAWKLNVQDQLPKYFEAECKLFTTQCALAECEAFGKCFPVCLRLYYLVEETICLE